jgi:pimeloyl-ACP methyl ester carboxylesterase
VDQATYEELFTRVVTAARDKRLPVADPTPPLSCKHRGLHLLDWQGNNLHPLLLLHGALLQAHVWDFFCLDMRRYFHIYALDLPGHGDSDWSTDGDYSRSRVAKGVAALIDQLRLQQTILIGHSFGGSVAALVATQIPDKIQSLVIVDSTLLPTGRPSVRTRSAAGPQTFSSYEAFVQHAARLGRRGDPARLVNSLRWNARQLSDGLWTWKYDPALRRTPLGPGDFEDVWSALAKFPKPILFVRAGEYSHLTDAAAERLQTLPNVRLVTVPDAAHNVMSDNPLAFQHEVGKFLSVVGGTTDTRIRTP